MQRRRSGRGAGASEGTEVPAAAAATVAAPVTPTVTRGRRSGAKAAQVAPTTPAPAAAAKKEEEEEEEEDAEMKDSSKAAAKGKGKGKKAASAKKPAPASASKSRASAAAAAAEEDEEEEEAKAPEEEEEAPAAAAAPAEKDGEEEEEEEDLHAPRASAAPKATGSAKGQKRARTTTKKETIVVTAAATSDDADAPASPSARRSSRPRIQRVSSAFMVATYQSSEEEEEEEEEEEGEGDADDKAVKSEAEGEADAAAEEDGEEAEEEEAKAKAPSSPKRTPKKHESEDDWESSSAGDEDPDDDDYRGPGGTGARKRAAANAAAKRAASPTTARKPRGSAAGGGGGAAKSPRAPRAKKDPKARKGKAAAKAGKKPGKAKVVLAPLSPEEDADLIRDLDAVKDSFAPPVPVPGQTKAQAAAAAAAAAAASASDVSCCSRCASKECFRAVAANDLRQLDALCDDFAHVASPLATWSADQEETCLHRAIRRGDKFLVRKLLHELNLHYWAQRAAASSGKEPKAATDKAPAVRVAFPANALQKQSTGQASYIAYGHRVAAVNVSRGGKEGNNAFVADADAMGEEDFASYFSFLMRVGTNPDLIEVFAQAIDPRRTTYANAMAALKPAPVAAPAASAAAAAAARPGLTKQKSQLKDAMAAASALMAPTAGASAASAASALQQLQAPVFDIHTREDEVHRLLGQSNDFHTAVAAGNLTMARAAFAFSQKRGGSGGLAPAAAPGSYEFGQSRMGGMNQLHADVLATDGKPISYKFKSISVTKKSGGNHSLTPIHLAAINPDVQYLKALADVLGVQPLLTTTDDSNRGAVFYAAACSSPEPLKWLIGQGANIFATDRQQKTPLDFAVEAGRAANIALLVPQVPNNTAPGAKDDDDGAEAAGAEGPAAAAAAPAGDDGDDGEGDEDDEGPRRKKTKKKPAARKSAGGANKGPVFLGPTMPSAQSTLNLKNKRTGRTLFHAACELGDEAVVRALIAAGADFSAADKEKRTGLVFAAQKGHLPVVRLIYEHLHALHSADPKALTAALKAQFLAPDKLRRVPIVHAVKNGHFALLKYLLVTVGCAPDTADSSDNSLMHYAAAYGWNSIVQLLLTFVKHAPADSPRARLAGAASIWKTTPLFIGMLKGHLAVAASVLTAPHVNVDARDSEGLTVLHHVAASKAGDVAQAMRQLRFLIDERQADVTVETPQRRNALHIIAALPFAMKDRDDEASAVAEAAAAEAAEIAEALAEDDECMDDDDDGGDDDGEGEEDEDEEMPARSRANSKRAVAAKSPAASAAAAAPEADGAAATAAAAPAAKSAPEVSEQNAHDVEIATMLLARGLDVDRADESGHTALMLAIKAQNFPLVRFLLSRGARVNVSYGRTGSFATPLIALLGLERQPTKSEAKYLSEKAQEDAQREQRKHWGGHWSQPEDAATVAAKKAKHDAYLAGKVGRDAAFDAQREQLFALMLDAGRERSDPLHDALQLADAKPAPKDKDAAAGGSKKKARDDDDEDEDDEENEDEEDEDGDASEAKSDAEDAAGPKQLSQDGSEAPPPPLLTTHYLNGRDNTGATLLFHCLRNRRAPTLLAALFAHSREACAHARAYASPAPTGFELELGARDNTGRNVLFHAVAAGKNAVSLTRALLEYSNSISGGGAAAEPAVAAGGSKKKGSKTQTAGGAAAAVAAAPSGAVAAGTLDLNSVTRSGATLLSSIVTNCLTAALSTSSPEAILRLRGGARTKQTARKSTGGKAPRKQLATKYGFVFGSQASDSAVPAAPAGAAATEDADPSASPIHALQLVETLQRHGGLDLSSAEDVVVLHRRANAPPNPPLPDPAQPDLLPKLFEWDMDEVRRARLLDPDFGGAALPEGVQMEDAHLAELHAQLPHYTVQRRSFFSFLLDAYLLHASAAAKCAVPLGAAVGKYDPAARPRREEAAWLQMLQLVLRDYAAAADGPDRLSALLAEQRYAAPAGFFENALHKLVASASSFNVLPVLQLLVEHCPAAALRAAGEQADRNGCTPLLLLIHSAQLPLTEQALAVDAAKRRPTLAAMLQEDLSNWSANDDVAPPAPAPAAAAGAPSATPFGAMSAPTGLLSLNTSYFGAAAVPGPSLIGGFGGFGGGFGAAPAAAAPTLSLFGGFGGFGTAPAVPGPASTRKARRGGSGSGSGSESCGSENDDDREDDDEDEEGNEEDDGEGEGAEDGEGEGSDTEMAVADHLKSKAEKQAGTAAAAAVFALPGSPTVSLPFALTYQDLSALISLLLSATGLSVDARVGKQYWDPETLQKKKNVVAPAGAAAAAAAPESKAAEDEGEGEDEEMTDDAATVEADSSDYDSEADDDDDAAAAVAAGAAAAGAKAPAAASCSLSLAPPTAAPAAAAAAPARAAKQICRYGAKCYRKNPLHFAEFAHGDEADALSASADDDDGAAAVAAAASLEDLYIIPVQENLGQTALHLAVLARAAPLVELLVHKLQADVMAADAQKRTPLLLCAAQDPTGTTIPAALLRVRAAEQLLAVDGTGAHALSLVCQRTSTVTLAALLLGAADGAKAAEQTALTDANGRTALHFAVDYSCRRHGDEAAKSYAESFAMEALLLKQGADVNARDQDGRAPIHYVFVPIAAAYVKVGSKAVDPIEAVSDICAVTDPAAAAAKAPSRGQSKTAGAAAAGADLPARAQSFIHKLKDGVECFVAVDVADRFGRTPLLYAAAAGAQISVKYMKERGASLKTVDGDGNGIFQTALHYQRMSLAVDLIDQSVDLQRPIEPQRQEMRARHAALVAQGQLAEAARLDAAILSAEATSTFGFALRQRWTGLAYLMIDAGVSICRAVEDALSNNLLSLVNTLLQKTPTPRLREIDPATGRSLLHLLANFSPQDAGARQAFETVWSLKFAERLVDAGVEADQVDAQLGYTPLHYAALRGHEALAQFLLAPPRSVRNDVRGLNGYTPLLEACAHQRPAMVRLLAAHDPKLLARSLRPETAAGADGITPLHWAVAHNDTALAHFLLANKGAQVDPPAPRAPIPAQGWFAALPAGADADADAAAKEARRLRRSKYTRSAHSFRFVQSRAAGDPQFLHPLSPLQIALCAPAASLNWSLIRLLLAFGASPNLRVLSWRVGRQRMRELGAGCTLLMQAAQCGWDRLLALLLHEADPVEVAKEKARAAARALALAQGLPAPPVPPPSDLELKIAAAAAAHKPAPARVNERDSLGRTVVHRIVSPHGPGAPSSENVALLRRLVLASRNGTNEPADLGATDKDGRSALYYAYQQASGRMAAALIQLGAKADAKLAAAAAAAADQSWAAPAVDWAAMPEVDAAKDSAEFEAAAEAAAEAALDDPAAAAAAPPAAVDPLASDLVHSCVVYRSPISGAEYSVTMTCTEVNAGPYGKHSQYVMQLLWNPVQRLAILWTRWGRVGEDGQFQRTPFSSVELCAAEFHKIFKAKSGNSWETNRTKKTFVPIPNKYHIVFGKKAGDQGLLQGIDTIIARIPPGALPAPKAPKAVHSLLRTLCDVSRIHQLMSKMGYADDDDAGDSLAGKLSKSTLEGAFAKLKEISALVPRLQLADAQLKQQYTLRQQMERQIEIRDRERQEKAADDGDEGKAADEAEAEAEDPDAAADMDVDDGEEEEMKVSAPKKSAKTASGAAAAAAAPAAAAAAAAASADDLLLDVGPIDAAIAQLSSTKCDLEAEISTLSNSFFQLVPQPQHRRSAIKAISSVAEVQQYVAQLLQFLDLHVTQKLLLGCRLHPERMHPLDYVYAGLGVRLQRLHHRDAQFAAIRKYVYAQSHNERSLEIYNVFALSRRGEDERFEPFKALKNRTLLWHGSGIVNFNGILSQGLRIAPPEASVSGYAFGKGLYFADSFDKSFAYCRDFQGSFGFVGSQLPQQQQSYGRGYYGGRSARGGGDDSNADRASKVLLLCEVALGESYPAHQSEYLEQPKPGTHSTKALGSSAPDPAQSVYTPDGVYVPNGPIVPVAQPEDWRPQPPPAPQNYFCTSQSEYVIYNEGQARMRFLVQCGEPRPHYLKRLAQREIKRKKREREEEAMRKQIDVQ